MKPRNFFNFSKRNIYSSITKTDGQDEKIYLRINNEIKSFWHDIPYRNPNSSYNMVVEIPCQSRIIMEMSRNEENNPIMLKKNKVVKNPLTPIRIRDYSKDPLCNYGFFPQTYSSKENKFRDLFCGDSDPLDIIQMGGPFNHKPGDIINVNILGSFCLIDQGEMDWKVLVVNSQTDPSNITEEAIKKMMKWFKIFKTFYGKKENIILDNNKLFSIAETQQIIEESHQDYLRLMDKH